MSLATMSQVCLIICVLLIGGYVMIAYGTTPSPDGWSSWSPWGGCYGICGSGIRLRTRTCPDGAYCPGHGIDIGMCQLPACPIDGNWSAWRPWSACSVTCGSGHKRRTRTCINPLPMLGAASCRGSKTDSRPCNPRPCPLDVRVVASNFARNVMAVANVTRPTRCRSRTTTDPSCAVYTTYPDRDFLIILDSYVTTRSSTYEEVKDNIAWIAVHLCGNSACDLRVAGMLFATLAEEAFTFNEYSNKVDIHDAVIDMDFQHGSRQTFLAFEFAKDTMFTVSHGMRPGAIHQALLVTDGQSYGALHGMDARSLSAAAAQTLKDSGVEVFALMIGISAQDNIDEIRSYVSVPVDEHIFSVGSASELSELVDHLEILNPNVCV